MFQREGLEICFPHWNVYFEWKQWLKKQFKSDKVHSKWSNASFIFNLIRVDFETQLLFLQTVTLPTVHMCRASLLFLWDSDKENRTEYFKHLSIMQQRIGNSIWKNYALFLANEITDQKQSKFKVLSNCYRGCILFCDKSITAQEMWRRGGESCCFAKHFNWTLILKLL